MLGGRSARVGKPPKEEAAWGLGSAYGERVQSVGATAVAGGRLKVRMTAETVTEVVEYAGIAWHIAVPAVGVCAEGRYAQTG